jgi:hypothetical protein
MKILDARYRLPTNRRQRGRRLSRDHGPQGMTKFAAKGMAVGMKVERDAGHGGHGKTSILELGDNTLSFTAKIQP